MKKMMKFLSIALVSIFFSFVLSPNESWALNTRVEAGENVYDAKLRAHDATSSETTNTTSSNTTDTTGVGGTGTGTGNANIFAILKAKIYSTLVDLRRIVYVIAGFGLVMFAVLAIFNKVSYKHLGYIMISLCLLSLMFPFLEYFSGKGTIQVASQTQMDFKNFLSADYAMQQGTGEDEIKSAMNGKGEGGPSCNGEEGCEDEQLERLLPPDATVSATDVLKGSTMKNMKAFSDAGCPPSGGKGAWKANGTRPVCSTDANGNPVITQEQCTGKMNSKGKCVKTLAQGWNDFRNGVSQTANVVTSGMNAVIGVASTGAALVGGGTNVVNAMKDLGNAGNVHDVLQGLQNIAGSSSYFLNSTNASFQETLGGLSAAATSTGNLATIAATNPDSNPTGSNSVATGASDFNQNLNEVTKEVSKTVGEVSKRLGEGSKASAEADHAISSVESGIKTVEGIARRVTGQ